MSELQCLAVILMILVVGSMIGITFGVIARFLGDRTIT